MKNVLTVLLLVAAVSIASPSSAEGTTASENPVWRLGCQDGKSDEFALAPDGFRKFVGGDFGYEDRYFLVGRSDIGRDLPYVLPGPADTWAGTWHTAGLRTHQVNLLFQLTEVDPGRDFRLNVHLADYSKRFLPLLKISVNDQDYKTRLSEKQGFHTVKRKVTHEEPVIDTLTLSGDLSGATPETVVVTIPAGTLRVGNNEIVVSVLEGSWVMFDCIELFGNGTCRSGIDDDVYVRGVRAADYETVRNGRRVQPLLLDLEHLSGEPTIKVRLDGKEIFAKRIERARYVLEVPMPQVKGRRVSDYEIFCDGRLLLAGQVVRSPREQITPAGYVDTRIGSAHSRWMIAPGPWMPFGMVKLSPDNQNPGWQSGYQPTFENIGCFSHIHEWTMAGLGIMAANGPLRVRVGDEQDPDSGYRSRMDKRTEQAGIGSYSVHLTDYDIHAQLYPPRHDAVSVGSRSRRSDRGTESSSTCIPGRNMTLS